MGVQTSSLRRQGTAQNIGFLLSPFARIRFAEIAPIRDTGNDNLLLSLTINRTNLLPIVISNKSEKSYIRTKIKNRELITTPISRPSQGGAKGEVSIDYLPYWLCPQKQRN